MDSASGVTTPFAERANARADTDQQLLCQLLVLSRSLVLGRVKLVSAIIMSGSHAL
ncbi:hypothetical protein Pcac1_g18989 [Phytophthora cactorum]|nr:hypothetical protein Pcac1_g18989 [Phytophthora cactorum]KAG2880356.1 hypothetical protein PC114_g22111 [Phytophthora cactorum]KAG2978886.1 hypothetical protein PC119_g21643 [Phytophthora cactorum]KAG3161039.1 hypothetical protein PC128_g20896 [Phytophthora cactorum]